EQQRDQDALPAEAKEHGQEKAQAAAGPLDGSALVPAILDVRAVVGLVPLHQGNILSWMGGRLKAFRRGPLTTPCRARLSRSRELGSNGTAQIVGAHPHEETRPIRMVCRQGKRTLGGCSARAGLRLWSGERWGRVGSRHRAGRRA